jgi:dTDP-4-amino-4,6-dideoxygalactose transaminase
MRNFGFTDYDKTDHIGTNAKMSEFAAAYGLVHLDELDSIIEQNKKIHQAYLEEFSEFKELKFLDYTFPGKCNYQYVVAHVPSEIRDTLVDSFHAQGILLRRYFHPGCHRMEPYASHEQYQGLHLSNTEKISSEIVVFPTGTQVSRSTIKEFSDHFRKFKEVNKL